MLDPETLHTFIGVAETGSFFRAADHSCKIVATVSYCIRPLEESAGVVLFFRTTRSVTSTVAGPHLLSQAEDWLAWLDSMSSKLQQVSGGIEHRVNIVVSNLLYSPGTVAHLLSWLSVRYPFTQFHFPRQIYVGVWGSLLYEGFSLAIGVTGTEPMVSTFALSPLGSVRWRFVMSADHPLANINGSLTEAQLHCFPAINIKDSVWTLTKRVAWCLSDQEKIIIPDVETKPVAHLAGVGIDFVPQPLCRPLLDDGQLVGSIISTMRPPSPLGLAWYKSGTGKAVDDIVTLFTQRRPEITELLTTFNGARD